MNNKWAARFLVLLLLLIGATTSYAQDTPPAPPPLIANALADLSQKLGTTVGLSNLTSWSFQQTVYTDTALGCTLTSGQPSAQGITAYRFALEYKGKTYDYRVSADGGIIIACDAGLLNVPSAPTTTASAGCPANFAGYLAPRIKVNTQARVIASNSAPNRLRSAPATNAEQLTLIQPGRTFDVIGGPSCGQNYVWWQVVYNGQTGWTVEGQLPDVYYLEPVNAAGTATATVAGTAIAATAVATSPAATPAQPSVPAAVNAALMGVTNKLITLYNLDDGGIPTVYASLTDVSSSNGLTLDQAAWSPDGQHLAYTVYDQNYVAHLFITDRAGSTPVELSSDIYSQLPISFTSDSAQVLYGKKNTAAPTATPVSNGPAVDQVQIFTQPVAGTGAAAAIATVNFGVGCGGGSPFPGDWQYSSEAGYEGHHHILAMTQFGILYTKNCTGIGTALLKLDNGQSTDVGANLSRVSVSPDGTQVVGIVADPQTPINGVLTIVDLQTLQPTPIAAAAAPDQIAWGPDGGIYYTTISNGQTIPGSDSAVVSNGTGQGLIRRSVGIHRVDLAATTDTEIYSAAAYAIGRLFVTPDNQALYFSSIPNGDRYVDALNKGVITQQAAQSDLLAYFPIEFYRIALPNDAAQQVSADLAKATLNDAAFKSGAATTTGVTPTAEG